MNIVEQEDWAYTLFHDGLEGGYFLETVCGTIGVYCLTIRLSADEVEAMKADPSFIKDLARKITYSPTKYMSRRVPDFEPEPHDHEL